MRLRTFLMPWIVGGSLFTAAAARADNYPVIVVPGRPGVPVIINGRDASWAVVNGDWGLYRPGAVPVTVIYPQRWIAPVRRHHVRHRPVRRHVTVRRRAPAACACRQPNKAPPAPAHIPLSARHYFPGGVKRPALGRREVEPNTPPEPAESFFRSWSTQSTPAPADVAPSSAVVVAPTIVEKRRIPRRSPVSDPAASRQLSR
jgi:hypothetical protein